MPALNLGVFHCPVCRGPIARWVIRTTFTCHHCNWTLASNLVPLSRRALALAVAAELALFGCFWLYTGSALAATGIYFYVAIFLGALVWFLVMDLGLVLTAVRPAR